MNVDTGTDPRDLTGLDALKKKAPRKPRPSELAAKAAKAKKGTKKPAKPKAKKKVTKKPAAKKSKAKRPAPKKAKAAKVDTREKPCRIDCRVTKAEKVRITAKAKRLRRTVTSLLVEAVQKIK